MSTTHNHLNCLSFNLLAFHTRNSNPEKLLDQGHWVSLTDPWLHERKLFSLSPFLKVLFPLCLTYLAIFIHELVTDMFIFNRNLYLLPHTRTFELKEFVVRKFIWTVIIVMLHHWEKSQCEWMVQKTKDIWSGVWEYTGQSNYSKCLSMLSNRK